MPRNPIVPVVEIAPPPRRRATSLLPLLALLLVGAGLGVVATGCSGGSEKRRAAAAADTPLPADPAAALAELDRRIEAAPKDIPNRVARAELLERMGRFEDATEEWAAVLARKPKSAMRGTAWSGRARTLEQILGDVRVIAAGNGTATERAETLLRAWREVGKSDRRTGLLGEVCTLYRLGRFDAARDAITRAANRSDEGSTERLLVLLLDEQAGKHPTQVVRVLDDYGRVADPVTRELATQQLVRLAENADESEVAHTAEGLLVRLSRESENPVPALLAWETARTRGKGNRIEVAQRNRALEEAESALSRNHPMLAWRSLEPLLRDETAATPELVDLVDRCCAQLSALCEERLADGAVGSAEEVATAIRGLPQSWLTPASKEAATRSLHRTQVATVRERAQTTLANATKAVDEQRPEEALTLVDPLIEQLPEELIGEVQTIRARALAQLNRTADALDLLEKYGPFSDAVVQRLHGSLLAEIGRGEEAEALLENLPLKYFNIEAFDALLVALASQAKWEKLIARLNTLGGELPPRYRPIRKQAVVGAAERMIRNLDPDGAIALLRGNLDEREVLSEEAGPVLVRAYLSAGRTDEALSFLVSEDQGLANVPADLVREITSRAGGQLETSQRFQLLRRLPVWERDESTAEFLASNWPRYGDYLPAPGTYEATVQVRTYSDESQILTDVSKKAIYEWKNSYFLIDTIDDEKETWRIDGDLWVRSTAMAEWWIPVQVEENPPLPEVVSPDGVKAQVVEAGHSIQIRDTTYTGCVAIEVRLPSHGPDEMIRIDLAPEVGEVRWHRKIGRLTVESRELLDLSKVDASANGE